MKNIKDIIGKKFNKLLVLDVFRKNNETFCKCDCGNIKIIRKHYVEKGRTKSCGCLNYSSSCKNHTHKMSKTKLYSRYNDIKKRCYNKNSKSYKNYGGRGITICQEWLDDFMNFYNWAINNGYKDNLTIDRIDVNGNYEPDNCRWATLKEQANNKRNNNYITYNGETHTLKEWSEILDINYKALHLRIVRRNWDIERAFTTPLLNTKKSH